MSQPEPGACGDPGCYVLHADPSHPIHPPDYEPAAACPWRTFPGAKCSCGNDGHALTFADVLNTDWPDGGYPLPDGRLVVEARSDGTVWGRGRVHLCLSDDTCASGMPNERITDAN